MKKTQHYVGLDVHKDTIMIAVADGGELHVDYEARPIGYVLYRRLRQLGIDCVVVAPSRTPWITAGLAGAVVATASGGGGAHDEGAAPKG